MPRRFGEYYPARYRGSRHSFTERMRTVLRRRASESYFPRGFKGRLLDVGCGDGSFALEMRRRGWAVSATEIDDPTVKMLRAKGVDAKSPEEAERRGFEALFDAVTCCVNLGLASGRHLLWGHIADGHGIRKLGR
jgi:2-polyprenyl-3-methyl-5-hydroxy-6-metoxy-1,4-benzoquinol methylase